MRILIPALISAFVVIGCGSSDDQTSSSGDSSAPAGTGGSGGTGGAGGEGGADAAGGGGGGGAGGSGGAGDTGGGGMGGGAQAGLDPWPADPSLALDTNFESGSYAPWKTEIVGGGKIVIITDDGTAENAVNSGSKAVKMTVSGQDTYRAELKNSSSPGGKLDYDSEYYLGFAFRVEEWGQSNFGMLFQTHAVPSTWNGCTSGRNPVSITVTSDGRLGFHVINNPKSTTAAGGAGGVLVWSEPDPVALNAWQRWVIRIKPSAASDGVIQAWLNGDEIYERVGANVDALDTCGKPQDNWIYAKIGIYKTYANTNSQAVVYDDVRIVKSSSFPAAYNLVRPPGLPAK